MTRVLRYSREGQLKACRGSGWHRGVDYNGMSCMYLLGSTHLVTLLGVPAETRCREVRQTKLQLRWRGTRALSSANQHKGVSGEYGLDCCESLRHAVGVEQLEGLARAETRVSPSHRRAKPSTFMFLKRAQPSISRSDEAASSALSRCIFKFAIECCITT